MARASGWVVLLTAAWALASACPADEGSTSGDAPADVAGGADGVSADLTGEAAPGGACDDWAAERRVLFGDLHVHTALSLDANLQGTRLGPSDAYSYARGEALAIQPYDASGQGLRTIQIGRPLDFAAVTDHAEFLGTVHICTTPGTPGYDHDMCVQYRDNPGGAFITINYLLAADRGLTEYPAVCGADGAACVEPGKAAWQVTRDAAAAADDPCSFSTLIGYEWSGNPGTFNLHRNVIFASDVVPEWPTGYLDESWPQGLWDALRRDCLDADTGCDVLAIPHNSNLSGGLMFDALDQDGAPYDAGVAAEQAALEPLVEIFQHKGDSECAPGSPVGDELCGFEKMPYDSLAGAALDLQSAPQDRDFVRDALGEGMRMEAKLGTNPWRFGIIASTDTHISAPGSVAEDGFPGHGGAGDSHADEVPVGLPDSVAFNPGGLAAVWAEENSRASIFAALKRREVYGTSGPRISLRFFAGWEYVDGLCDAVDLATQGYAGGVPMGGALPEPPAGDATPRFVVSALRDATDEGAPLQRVQLIKLWVEGGEVKQQVFEVAGDTASDASVDLTTCEPTGAAGADALCGVIEDTTFDPTRPSLWYARVLEDPRCRWSARQCVAAGVGRDDPGPLPSGFGGCGDGRFDWVIQERAWSSPVWYVPGG